MGNFLYGQKQRVFERFLGHCFYCKIKLHNKKYGYPEGWIREKPVIICGIERRFEYNPEWFTVDHLVPTAKGGKHHPLNWVASCRRCNCKKSRKLIDIKKAKADWKEWKKKHLHDDFSI